MCLFTSDAGFAYPKDITSVAFFLLDNVDGFKREFSVSDTSCATPFPFHPTMADRRLLDCVTRELSLGSAKPHRMNTSVSQVCCTREGTCACRTTFDPLPSLIIVPLPQQNSALYAIAFVAPLLLQWLINFATVRSWWDAHASALGCETTEFSENVDICSSRRRCFSGPIT